MAPARQVIVTGASSGIGLGIALAFLEQGEHVVLVSGCQECISEGVELLGGRLHILVNNAGAGTYSTPLQDLSIDDWDWHMSINLRSVFVCTQAAMPHLIASRGNIINVSSIAAKRPMAGAGAYCVAKAGVDMLTQQCALELASKGVRVNALNPATVHTNFHTSAQQVDEEACDDFYEKAARIHPIGRIGQPEDISSMALFLSNDELSGWVTGQCVVMDGGRLLTSVKA